MSTTGDKRIKAGVDRRKDERFSSHTPIIISNFDTMLHREYASVSFNISKNGLCLEAAEAIKPGTTLLIRRGNLVLDASYDVSCKLVRTSSLAEVRWYRERVDKLGKYYSIGVKYY